MWSWTKACSARIFSVSFQMRSSSGRLMQGCVSWAGYPADNSSTDTSGASGIHQRTHQGKFLECLFLHRYPLGDTVSAYTVGAGVSVHTALIHTAGNFREACHLWQVNRILLPAYKAARLVRHPVPGWLRTFGWGHCRKYTLADTALCGSPRQYWHPHRLGRYPPVSGRSVPVPWPWAAPPPTSRTPGTTCRMLPGTRHTDCGAARTSCRPHTIRN